MVEKVHFFLKINLNDEVDVEDIDLLTRSLGNEIKDFTSVDSIKPARLGDLPPGAKSSDPVTVGILAVTTLPSVLPALIEFIKSWTLRGNNRSVTIKVQEGDKLVEVSYPVRGDMSNKETIELAQELKTLLK